MTGGFCKFGFGKINTRDIINLFSYVGIRFSIQKLHIQPVDCLK